MLKKIIIVLLLTVFLVTPARSFDDWNWQEMGYDFRVLTYSDYDFGQNQSISGPVEKIGSLSGWHMDLDENNLPRFATYPFLGLREDYVSVIHPGYRIPPTLGIMRPTDFPPAFEAVPQSTNDWVHREFSYIYGNGREFKLLMSRLTPAILLTSDAPGIRLFDGKKAGIKEPDQTWKNVQGAEFVGNPAYFAIPKPAGVEVRMPDAAGTVDLSGMDQKWFLMWFGHETYLWGSDKVVNPQRGPASSGDMYNPSKWLFPVDMPVLVVMEKYPQILSVDPNGGVEIDYGPDAQAGQLAVMPLLGAKYPYVTETEPWSTGLPADIEAKCRWWYERLGQFPVSVAESYSVDSTTYDVRITDTFTYRSLGHGHVFAPIPPVVALAKQEGFPISFAQSITDSGLSLTVGPLKGVDQTTSYTYTISGLAKYALEHRIVTNTGQEPAWLKSRLEKELTNIINAGHLAPWWPRFGKQNIFEEMAIWSMPWETPYYLGQTLPLLEQPLSSSVIDYISRERQTYPPESYQRSVEWLNRVQTIPYDVGARRETHQVDTTQKPNELQNPYNRLDVRSLMTLYMLSQYYSSIGAGTELDAQWATIKDILKPYVHHSDWSTMTMTPYTWPQGRYEGILRGGIGETNRMVAGATGFIRLARLISDQEATDFGFYLLNKALISRFAQDKLVKHLYETGLQTMPENPNWQVQISLSLGSASDATLWRNDWRSYEDDVRRPLRFDQFGIVLENGIPLFGEMELLAYSDLTPELARFLRDFLLAEATEWYEAVEENSPAWYEAYADSYLGNEAPFSIPHNAHQIFMVKAWILNETPANLTTYTEIPWVHIGDYYYIHKLAETIKVYRGIKWENTTQ